jgi:glutaconyl-CoA/methylmalonyl-CoA decarboxylase subunit gamma
MRKYEVSINNKQYSVVVKKYTQQDAELEINGTPYMVKLDAPVMASAPQVQPMQPAPVQAVQPQPVQAPVAVQPAAVPAPAPAAEGEAVTAPIPGSILEILVKAGDQVKEGQTVFKMEAMKMENDINATCDGVVKSINVGVGDAVNQGQDLMVIG